MRLVDADALGNRMYHESFEKDSDLQRWDGGCWIRYKLFEQVLRAAPTIDPTHPTPSKALGALDCVERQAAIEACTDRNGICIAKQRLLELPSVHPDKDLIHLQKEQAYMQGYEDERKPRKGKWTRHCDGNEWYWYCSSCKEHWYEEDLWMGGNSFPNFCPNCGCRMEEGDSDER